MDEECKKRRPSGIFVRAETSGLVVVLPYSASPRMCAAKKKKKTQKDVRTRSTRYKPEEAFNALESPDKTYPQGREPYARAADASTPYVDAIAPATTAQRPEANRNAHDQPAVGAGGEDGDLKTLGPSHPITIHFNPRQGEEKKTPH